MLNAYNDSIFEMKADSDELGRMWLVSLHFIQGGTRIHFVSGMAVYTLWFQQATHCT
jgi:hypothetical protein